MDTNRPLVPLPTTGLHQRAGDLDRSAVCDQLSTHFAAGRLRPDELDARLGAAVNAETLLDLRRLVSDLPLPPAPAPAPVPAWTPVRRQEWRTLDVLALLALIGSLGFAALMVLVLGAGDQSWLVVAGFFGGSVAAVGGASLTHLVHRGLRARQERPAHSDAGQRPRIA
jgi:hypothetical protein